MGGLVPPATVTRPTRAEKAAAIVRACSTLETAEARALCARLAMRARWSDPAIQELLAEIGVDVASTSEESVRGQLELPVGESPRDVQRGGEGRC